MESSTASPSATEAPPAKRPPAVRPRSDAVARAFPLVLVVGALLVWEIGARAGWIPRILYPPPSAIAAALGEMTTEGVLARHLSASALRIVVGFLCGAGIGLLVGISMGASRQIRIALDPLISVAHPLPRLALLPLILLLFGVGETARIVVVSIACFFPMLINAVAGVRQIEPVYFEVARNFGAGRLQVLTRVLLPGALPSVAAGTRLALIRALKTTIGIELITSEDGLGHLLWFSWETFRPDELYASLVVVAVIGYLMNVLLKRMVARFQPSEGKAAA